jgi:hypothetical protein
MDNIKAHRDEVTGRWFMRGVENEKVTYAKMIYNLNAGKNFKFSRFGDGEWNCIFSKSGQNCDGHKYFKDLGESLAKVILSEPQYTVGLQPLSMSYDRTDMIKNFCRGLKINWVNADLLHSASIDNELDKFITAIQSRYVIVVGPPHLAAFFNYGVHIVIPTVDCWLSYQEIKKQISFHIEESQNAVVLFAASMMSEVLIHDFKDHDHTFIDVGSVFDPFCGVKSRRYHHKLKL